MFEDLKNAYASNTLKTIQLGGITVDGELLPQAPVNLILKQLNRHGLIAGATGSGKTKTIQVLCEQLSKSQVPSFVMDIKGDISGLAASGVADKKLEDRNLSLGLEFLPHSSPVEMLTLSSSICGIPLRATIQDFGALLFSRMLDLNDTQTGVVTILFEYSKNNNILLIDLVDFKELLKFSQTESGKTEIEQSYGRISASSVSSIMRKIIEIESQGGNYFFGEPAFDITDLMQTTQEGQGVISILRLMDMQDKPQLFSSVMLKLLNDVYRQLPESGDLDSPKLVIFIDEAHLIFKNASKALFNLMDTIVKLIRSKGVGLVFCTQTPKDIPENILSQLGFKIQHALRAFTAKDRIAIKLAAQNFPSSDYYNTEKLLTSLGIGEALVSAIDEKGKPTPLVQCMVRAPESRMGTLTPDEEKTVLQQSILYPKYQKRLDRTSAYEVLSAREAQAPIEEISSQQKKPQKNQSASMLETLSKNTLVRQVTRDFFRKCMQIVLSMIKKMGNK